MRVGPTRPARLRVAMARLTDALVRELGSET
jgi:hypothetical protein